MQPTPQRRVELFHLTRQLRIASVTAPKQTDTVQRWKLQVSWPGAASPVPTKIEFSRRPREGDALYEQVDPQLIQSYELYPVLCRHYTRESAVTQKIGALVHRAEAQARDVFDLDHLLRGGRGPGEVPQKVATEVDRAIETALSIPYPAFKSQVVAYIAPEFQAHFGSERAWNEVQERVVSALAALEAKGRR